MKKTVVLTLIALFLWSCHNNINSEDVASKHISAPKVAQCIEEAFAYYIGREDNPDTSIVYVMEFSRGYPSSKQEDTLIAFGQMHKRMPLNGLKGFVTIGDYKLLVFDESGIGTNFYNLDSLQEVDLRSLEFSTDSIMIFRDFIIVDSLLEMVGVQADDFVPIRVNNITP